MPKLAIFAATVEEATKTVRPAVEKILSELDIPLSSILVNTGDTTVTKDEDIRNFRNLDVQGTEGSQKQFIILVEKAERVGTVAPARYRSVQKPEIKGICVAGYNAMPETAQ